MYELPPILTGTEQDQLRAIRDYLVRLAQSMEQSGAGTACFLRMAQSPEIGLVAAAKEAGLQNPVTDQRVREVTEFLSNVLSK